LKSRMAGVLPNALGIRVTEPAAPDVWGTLQAPSQRPCVTGQRRVDVIFCTSLRRDSVEEAPITGE
jgi:hypothetical protein